MSTKVDLTPEQVALRKVIDQVMEDHFPVRVDQAAWGGCACDGIYLRHREHLVAMIAQAVEKHELAVEGLAMQWDADHRFPFIEDENCNITGYGHQDPAQFAAAINRYDEVCNGAPFPADDQWDAASVMHRWVIVGPDDESLHAASEGESGAIPVTTLWGQR